MRTMASVTIKVDCCKEQVAGAMAPPVRGEARAALTLPQVEGPLPGSPWWVVVAVAVSNKVTFARARKGMAMEGHRAAPPLEDREVVPNVTAIMVSFRSPEEGVQGPLAEAAVTEVVETPSAAAVVVETTRHLPCKTLEEASPFSRHVRVTTKAMTVDVKSPSKVAVQRNGKGTKLATSQSPT
jgi:hypothetical protein